MSGWRPPRRAGSLPHHARRVRGDAPREGMGGREDVHARGAAEGVRIAGGEGLDRRMHRPREEEVKWESAASSTGRTSVNS